MPNETQELVRSKDVATKAGLQFDKLLAQEITYRFVAANTMYAVPHDLGVIPKLVCFVTQLTSGSPSAVYCEARPRDESFLYVKCSVANTNCKISVMG